MSILTEVAQALVYMHALTPPLAHFDIKASNILVDQAYRSRLADFGVSKTIARGGRGEGESSIVGSNYWMAPEMFKGLKCNAQADIFSFGMLIAEMSVVGGDVSDLFPSHDTPKTVARRAAMEGLRPDLDSLPTDLHHVPGLKELAQRCWAEDPSERPLAVELVCVLHRLSCELEIAERDRALDHDSSGGSRRSGGGVSGGAASPPTLTGSILLTRGSQGGVDTTQMTSATLIGLYQVQLQELESQKVQLLRNLEIARTNAVANVVDSVMVALEGQNNDSPGEGGGGEDNRVEQAEEKASEEGVATDTERDVTTNRGYLDSPREAARNQGHGTLFYHRRRSGDTSSTLTIVDDGRSGGHRLSDPDSAIARTSSAGDFQWDDDVLLENDVEDGAQDEAQDEDEDAATL